LDRNWMLHQETDSSLTGPSSVNGSVG